MFQSRLTSINPFDHTDKVFVFGDNWRAKLKPQYATVCSTIPGYNRKSVDLMGVLRYSADSVAAMLENVVYLAVPLTAL